MYMNYITTAQIKREAKRALLLDLFGAHTIFPAFDASFCQEPMRLIRLKLSQ